MPGFAGFSTPHFGRYLLAPEAGEGGGGSVPQPAGTVPNTEPPAANIQGLLTRHNGDAMAVIATLMSENHGLREKNREVRKAVPPDGSLVLTGDAAGHWGVIQSAGGYATLKERLTKGEEALKFQAAVEKSKLYAEAGEVTQFNPVVLEEILSAKGIVPTITRGDKGKVATVTIDDKTMSLAEYAKQHLSHFLPALQASPGTPNAPQVRGGTTDTTKPSARNFTPTPATTARPKVRPTGWL